MGYDLWPNDLTVFLFQTLCILANIADGTTAKELIMTNDDILQKIKYYMVGGISLKGFMLVLFGSEKRYFSILSCKLLVIMCLTSMYPLELMKSPSAALYGRGVLRSDLKGNPAVISRKSVTSI